MNQYEDPLTDYEDDLVTSSDTNTLNRKRKTRYAVTNLTTAICTALFIV